MGQRRQEQPDVLDYTVSPFPAHPPPLRSLPRPPTLHYTSPSNYPSPQSLPLHDILYPIPDHSYQHLHSCTAFWMPMRGILGCQDGHVLIQSLTKGVSSVFFLYTYLYIHIFIIFLVSKYTHLCICICVYTCVQVGCGHAQQRSGCRKLRTGLWCGATGKQVGRCWLQCQTALLLYEVPLNILTSSLLTWTADS